MHTTRRTLLVGLSTLLLAGCAAQPEPGPVRGALPSDARLRGGRLLIAAHPDDDLFFMSPDLLDDHDARALTTVYATAGDAGDGFGYFSGRERGVRSAYAQMAGVADEWTSGSYRVAGRIVDLHVLKGAPSVRLVFLHLPDGGVEGTGYASTGDESLLLLRSRPAHVMHTIDGRAQTYTADTLLAVLQGIVAWSAPRIIRTLDFTLPLESDVDHADHRAIARFAQQAAATADPRPTLVPYMGYPVADLPINVSGGALTRKHDAFVAYAKHDSKICGSLDACGTKPEARWLSRQYRAT